MATYRRICSSVASSLPLQKGSETKKKSFKGTLSQNQCFGSGIRDGGKSQETGFGMNNPDHISESLDTIFWGLKYLKFFDTDSGSGMKYSDPGWKKFRYGIRDEHPGSATLLKTQHSS
jgi:hypothetical protein